VKQIQASAWQPPMGGRQLPRRSSWRAPSVHRGIDPGSPTVILSLSELEDAVGAAHAGNPAALTAVGPHGINVAEVISAHEQALGIPVARNPLLDAAYERALGDIDTLHGESA
jgi:hypothetical protein